MGEQAPGRLRVEFRNRIGSFLGAVGVLLVLGALLLGSSDFFAAVGEATSRLLTRFDVAHELLIPPPAQQAATGPELPEIVPAVIAPVVRHSVLAVIAAAVATAAATIVSSRLLRLPDPVIGAIAVAGTVLTFTMLAASYGNANVDGPIDRVVVDWRTSPLLPVAATVVVMGYSLYAIGRGLLQKLVWTLFAAALVVAFGVLRLAVSTAALSEFGPGSIIPMFAIAGNWLDLMPALAVLGLARYSVLASEAVIARVRPW